MRRICYKEQTRICIQILRVMLNWTDSKTVCRAVPVLNINWKTGAYSFWRNLFISKSMDITSQMIFISLWKSFSQYLLHPCDFESPALTPHLSWGDELAEQGQLPSLADWFCSTTFVKLGTRWLTGCSFHVPLGSSLKHCQQPAAQVSVSSTLPLQEGAQYSL